MWAKGIIAAFVVFALFMGGLVTICMKQDISLESKDYYKEELRYQKRIDAAYHTQDLNQRPKLLYQAEGQKLLIDFVAGAPMKGHIHLYKPDKSKEDFTIDFSQDVAVDMHNRAKGLWKVKISWVQDDTEFYHEESMLVD